MDKIGFPALIRSKWRFITPDKRNNQLINEKQVRVGTLSQCGQRIKQTKKNKNPNCCFCSSLIMFLMFLLIRQTAADFKSLATEPQFISLKHAAASDANEG